MPKEMILLRSFKELISDKWVHQMLNRLKTNRRRCFIASLHTFDTLKDSNLQHIFAEFLQNKCALCKSQDDCFTMLLGLCERKAEVEGRIDEVIPTIEFSLFSYRLENFMAQLKTKGII